MPTTNNHNLDLVLYSLCGAAILFIGYRLGRLVGKISTGRLLTAKEQELFTTQKGFKSLYDQELSTLRAQNQSLQESVQSMTAKVEDYRKKAAGFGGLFNSGGKKSDAMYALLLENEALEEALYSQNEKLKQDRTDSLKEQMRSTGYRRVLMSQLLNDQRIKDYVAEIMADDKSLPGASSREGQAALPAANS